jgi:hypothetical protein
MTLVSSANIMGSVKVFIVFIVGGRSFMYYGGPCFVDVPVLWRALFYESPFFCGGPCFVETPVALP